MHILAAAIGFFSVFSVNLVNKKSDLASQVKAQERKRKTKSTVRAFLEKSSNL
jgi:hypothetical protein